MLRFIVPGEPQAWQRVTKGKWHGKAVLPAESRAYQQTVAQYAQLAINTQKHTRLPQEVLAPYPQSGPFWLGAAFFLGTYPVKGHPHNFDGDLDNYIKNICDALQGIVWHNDKQVVGYIPGTHKQLRCNHPQAHVLIWHEADIPEEALSAWRNFQHKAIGAA